MSKKLNFKKITKVRKIYTFLSFLTIAYFFVLFPLSIIFHESYNDNGNFSDISLPEIVLFVGIMPAFLTLLFFSIWLYRANYNKQKMGFKKINGKKINRSNIFDFLFYNSCH